MKIYTKTGDLGETSLIGGQRVPKDHPRISAYGTLDELNSVVGLLRSELHKDHAEFGTIQCTLEMVQNNLFNIGSHLACEVETMRAKLPNLSAGASETLENEIDQWDTQLARLTQFILPGGYMGASIAHLARSVCRRAEREMLTLKSAGANVDAEQLIFINRFSDWLFVLARYLNFKMGVTDTVWRKG